ncbi:putative retinol dehydrogenase 12 [Tricladium varicosporioides]|nr:putative retinol dehydrogenase 12 [Hymenoscyphus varicosporioides]
MSKYSFSTTGFEIVSDFASQVKGRTFLITGPSEGGIGAETAISLAYGSPSTILLLGRSLPKIQPTIDAITKINSSITVKFVSVSLDSLKNVRQAANTILQDESIPKIDVVINNAAIMACPYALTEDGFESQFGTNHLSHYLLTNLLMPKILAAGPGAVIVNVSSTGHLWGGINFDSINFNDGKDYTPFKAYAQAKTANILFSVELNKRLEGEGVRSWTLHPGSIASGLQKYMTKDLFDQAMKEWFADGREAPERKNVQQGCSTTLRAALDPKLEEGRWIGEEGEEKKSVYLNDCEVVTDPHWLRGYALDEGAARKLWTASEEMVGEKFLG